MNGWGGCDRPGRADRGLEEASCEADAAPGELRFEVSAQREKALFEGDAVLGELRFEVSAQREKALFEGDPETVQSGR